MKILFVHQNFPGQFLHLAPALAARGHQVLAMTDEKNTRGASVKVARYRSPQPEDEFTRGRIGRSYFGMAERGLTVMRGARALRDRHGYVPDVVFGHPGWGETLFLRGIWPEARHLAYAEFFYSPTGLDVEFDPEFSPPNPDRPAIVLARQAHLAHAMAQADAGLAPTRFQASTFPPCFRTMLSVIHDGVDTARVAPNPEATLTLPNGRVLRAGDEVLSFVNRNIEPYRGAHIFLRALPEVLAARPEAQVVILGGDEVSYGAPAPGGAGWRAHLLAELEGRLDLSRVHFLGRVPYPQFLSLMQVTRVHAYLTYPFVLSWSLMEAMAAGAHVVGSRTAPVEEVVEDGVTGTLVDFFDVPGWSAALIHALAEPAAHDPLRLAARARIVERYDLATVCLPMLIAFVEGTAEG
jgi:glycosyltransferase involved in cell wall biosynthesis